jgi:hypothetical protein
MLRILFLLFVLPVVVLTLPAPGANAVIYGCYREGNWICLPTPKKCYKEGTGTQRFSSWEACSAQKERPISKKAKTKKVTFGN